MPYENKVRWASERSLLGCKGLILNGIRRKINFERPGQQQLFLNPFLNTKTNYSGKWYSFYDLLKTTHQHNFMWEEVFGLWRARDNSINQSTDRGDSHSTSFNNSCFIKPSTPYSDASRNFIRLRRRLVFSLAINLITTNKIIAQLNPSATQFTTLTS
jgi:hypothetical protein